MTRQAYTSRGMKQTFLQSLKDNFMFLVYDIETTGLDCKTNHIIQLSARKCFVTANGLEEFDQKVWWINPGYALPDAITKLTGITDVFLYEQPTEAQVIEEIVEYFWDTPVLGYNNTRFDDVFMNTMFMRYGGEFKPPISMDLYKVVKHVFMPGETLNHRLITISEHFGFGEQIENYHNAEGDTMATLLCCNAMISVCKKQLETEYENLVRCNVLSIARWESPYNTKMKRIYVETDVAVFYYDIFNETWYIKDDIDRISKYDLEDMICQVLDLTNLMEEADLTTFEGRLVA